MVKEKFTYSHNKYMNVYRVDKWPRNPFSNIALKYCASSALKLKRGFIYHSYGIAFYGTT